LSRPSQRNEVFARQEARLASWAARQKTLNPRDTATTEPFGVAQEAGSVLKNSSRNQRALLISKEFLPILKLQVIEEELLQHQWLQHILFQHQWPQHLLLFQHQWLQHQYLSQWLQFQHRK
jgi:hypothetical protein